jgi:hypothetical protein
MIGLALVGGQSDRASVTQPRISDDVLPEATGNPDTSSARSVSQHDQGTQGADNRLFWYPMKRETTRRRVR